MRQLTKDYLHNISKEIIVMRDTVHMPISGSNYMGVYTGSISFLIKKIYAISNF